MNEADIRYHLIDPQLRTKGYAAMDVALFDKIRLMRDESDRLTTGLAQVYRDVPVEVAESEIAEAVAAVRKR